MISPEEKIYSPQSKKNSAFDTESAEDNVSKQSETPCNAEDNVVPKQFTNVKPKTLVPRCLCLKKIVIGCAGVITTFAIVGTVSLYGDLSKSHSLSFSMPNPFCINVKTYVIFIRIICQKS